MSKKMIKAMMGLIPIKKQVYTQGGTHLQTYYVSPDDIGEHGVHDIGVDKAYDLFAKTYEQATGHAWTKDKFEQRAENWRFYGNEFGYITVRPQRSGFYKLVGMAGSAKSAIRGFQKLMSEDKPVWGMVDDKIANMSTRMGMIRPPALLIRLMLPHIAKAVFGKVPLTVNKDGSVTIDYPDVGKATKYFIGSKAYFRSIINSDRIPLPKIVKLGISKLLVG